MGYGEQSIYAQVTDPPPASFHAERLCKAARRGKLVWDFPGTSTAKAVGYTERDKNQDQGKEKAPEGRGTDGAPRRGGGENEAKEGTW
jgi:hypothetical protein